MPSTSIFGAPPAATLLLIAQAYSNPFLLTLAAPESITVKTIAGERFERITGWRLKERPVMREPGEDLEAGETWTSPAPPDDLEDDIPF